MVEVDGKGERLKGKDAAFIGHPMFREDLPLYYKVDGGADIRIEHECLSACDLSVRVGTESRREIILDLRYYLKRAGSKILSSLLFIYQLDILSHDKAAINIS